MIIDKSTQKPYIGFVTSSFIDADSSVLVYSENPTTTKHNAKAINIYSKQTIWEDNKEGDYSLSQTGSYLTASYEFGKIKIFSTKDFRLLNNGNNKQISEALISPDEHYAIQQEIDAGNLNERVVLYKLPDFGPMYTNLRDSIIYLNRFDPFPPHCDALLLVRRMLSVWQAGA